MIESTVIDITPSSGVEGRADKATARRRAVHANPAWFGAVMGTGALTLALANEAAHWPSPTLTAATVVALLLASAYAIVLTPRYLRRLGNGAALGREIADPARGPMLATFPAGILVLALSWGHAGPMIMPTSAAAAITIALLAVGVLASLTYGIAWTAILLRSTIEIEQVNGGWLIPPVMTLLVPLGIQPLAQRFPGATPLLVMVGFAFLGIGALVFLALFGLLMMRLALHAPLSGALAPSLLIPLAPAPVLGMATLRLLQLSAAHGIPGFGGVGAGLALSAIGLGFAGWWLAVVAIELGRLHRLGGLESHPGWWGFVFPIGAVALTFDAAGTALASSALVWTGSLVTIVLLILWAVIAVRTAREVLM